MVISYDQRSDKQLNFQYDIKMTTYIKSKNPGNLLLFMQLLIKEV